MTPRFLIPALVALALTGCSLPAPQASPPRVTLPEGRAAMLASPDDLRDRARSFVTVVTRVEPVAEAECRRASALRNCDFRIVVDDRPGMPPNAFQTIDDQGRPLIAFTLALIAAVQNPDELAFVMGHETAHHIAGHLERQNQAAMLGATVFGNLAGTLAGASPESVRTAQEIGAAVGARRYSQDFELEADALGTVITARAGYDPLIGAQFFLRIPDPGNRFLGTHPPNAERLATVLRVEASL